MENSKPRNIKVIYPPHYVKRQLVGIDQNGKTVTDTITISPKTAKFLDNLKLDNLEAKK